MGSFFLSFFCNKEGDETLTGDRTDATATTSTVTATINTRRVKGGNARLMKYCLISFDFCVTRNITTPGYVRISGVGGP